MDVWRSRGLPAIGLTKEASSWMSEKGWVVGVCHALMSFDTRCPVIHRSGCFRPSDQMAGWDSHPLEIADFHGVLDSWCVSLANEF